MASLTTDGLERLILDMEEISEIPSGVAEKMLEAGADVLVQGQREMAISMGVVDSGQVAASIVKGKVKKTKDGYSVSVYPKGSRRRGNTTTRNAEIAFVNEFGKRGQFPRPFIRTANEKYGDKAVDAVAEQYDRFLKSKNL